MCVAVYVRGERCESVGELRSAVPCDPVSDLQDHVLTEDECLCNVDMEKTLEAAGVTWSREDGWGDYVVPADWYAKKRKQRLAGGS